MLMVVDTSGLGGGRSTDGFVPGRNKKIRVIGGRCDNGTRKIRHCVRDVGMASFG